MTGVCGQQCESLACLVVVHPCLHDQHNVLPLLSKSGLRIRLHVDAVVATETKMPALAEEEVMPCPGASVIFQTECALLPPSLPVCCFVQLVRLSCLVARMIYANVCIGKDLVQVPEQLGVIVKFIFGKLDRELPVCSIQGAMSVTTDPIGGDLRNKT